MLNRNGQVVSYDLMIAIFIFLLVFAVVLSTWVNNLNAIAGEQQIYDMKNSVVQLADMLVMTAGIPSNWHLGGDANLYGFATSRRVLSLQKLDAFKALDYNSARDRLRIANYDFYIKIEQDFNKVYEFGNKKGGAETAISSTRVVNYNGQNAIFSLWLYK